MPRLKTPMLALAIFSILAISACSGDVEDSEGPSESKNGSASASSGLLADRIKAQRERDNEEANANASEVKAPGEEVEAQVKKESNAEILNGEVSFTVSKPYLFQRAQEQIPGELKTTFQKVGDDLVLAKVRYVPKAVVLGVAESDLISIWVSGDELKARTFSVHLADQGARDIVVEESYESNRNALKVEEHAWRGDINYAAEEVTFSLLMKFPELKADSYRVSMHYLTAGRNGNRMVAASYPKEADTQAISPKTYAKLSIDSLESVKIDTEKMKRLANERRSAFAKHKASINDVTAAEKKLEEIEDVEAREAKREELSQRRKREITEFAVAHPNDPNAASDAIYSMSPAHVSVDRIVAFAKRFPALFQRSIMLAQILYDDSRVEEFLAAVRGVAELAMMRSPYAEEQGLTMLSSFGISYGLMKKDNIDICADYLVNVEKDYPTDDKSLQSNIAENRLVMELARSNHQDEKVSAVIANLIKLEHLRPSIEGLFQRLSEDRRDIFDPLRVSKSLLKSITQEEAKGHLLFWMNMVVGRYAIQVPDAEIVRELLPDFETLVDLGETIEPETQARAVNIAILALSKGLYGDLPTAKSALDHGAALISEMLKDKASDFLNQFANAMLAALQGYQGDDHYAWVVERRKLVADFLDAYGSVEIRASFRDVLIDLEREENDWDAAKRSAEELLAILPEISEESNASASKGMLKQKAELALAAGYLLGSDSSSEEFTTFFKSVGVNRIPLITLLLKRSGLSANRQDVAPPGALRAALTGSDERVKQQAEEGLKAIAESFDPKTEESLLFSFSMELVGYFAETGDLGSSNAYLKRATNIWSKSENQPKLTKAAGYRRFIFARPIVLEREGKFAEALQIINNHLLANPDHSLKNELVQMSSRLELEIILTTQPFDTKAANAWVEKHRDGFSTVAEDILGFAALSNDIFGASFVPSGAINQKLSAFEMDSALADNLFAFVSVLESAKEPAKAFEVAVRVSDVFFHVGRHEAFARFHSAAGKIEAKNRQALQQVFELWKTYHLNSSRALGLRGDFSGAAAKADATLKALSSDLLTLGDQGKGLKSHLEIYQDSYTKMHEQWEAEKTRRAAVPEDSPKIRVTTDIGSYEVVLYEDEVPNHSTNMVQLAEDNFYSNTRFHRHVPHFVIQGGSNVEDGSGSGGFTIALEAGLPHYRGALAMARSQDPNSASAQFYIVTDNSPNAFGLNGAYTVFGHVTKGMEIVDRIRVGTKILKVEVIQKRDHEYIAKRVNR